MSENRCTFNVSSVFTINSQSTDMTPPGREPQTVMSVTSSTRIKLGTNPDLLKGQDVVFLRAAASAAAPWLAISFLAHSCTW